jgi:uridine kinase
VPILKKGISLHFDISVDPLGNETPLMSRKDPNFSQISLAAVETNFAASMQSFDGVDESRSSDASRTFQTTAGTPNAGIGTSTPKMPSKLKQFTAPPGSEASNDFVQASRLSGSLALSYDRSQETTPGQSFNSEGSASRSSGPGTPSALLLEPNIPRTPDLYLMSKNQARPSLPLPGQSQTRTTSTVVMTSADRDMLGRVAITPGTPTPIGPRRGQPCMKIFNHEGSIDGNLVESSAKQHAILPTAPTGSLRVESILTTRPRELLVGCSGVSPESNSNHFTQPSALTAVSSAGVLSGHNKRGFETAFSSSTLRANAELSYPTQESSKRKRKNSQNSKEELSNSIPITSNRTRFHSEKRLSQNGSLEADGNGNSDAASTAIRPCLPPPRPSITPKRRNRTDIANREASFTRLSTSGGMFPQVGTMPRYDPSYLSQLESSPLGHRGLSLPRPISNGSSPVGDSVLSSSPAGPHLPAPPPTSFGPIPQPDFGNNPRPQRQIQQRRPESNSGDLDWGHVQNPLRQDILQFVKAGGHEKESSSRPENENFALSQNQAQKQKSNSLYPPTMVPEEIPRFVIAISGPTSSGKTTITHILNAIFKLAAKAVENIHQDDYLKPTEECPQTSWDDPSTFEREIYGREEEQRNRDYLAKKAWMRLEDDPARVQRMAQQTAANAARSRGLDPETVEAPPTLIHPGMRFHHDGSAAFSWNGAGGQEQGRDGYIYNYFVDPKFLMSGEDAAGNLVPAIRHQPYVWPTREGNRIKKLYAERDLRGEARVHSVRKPNKDCPDSIRWDAFLERVRRGKRNGDMNTNAPATNEVYSGNAEESVNQISKVLIEKFAKDVLDQIAGIDLANQTVDFPGRYVMNGRLGEVLLVEGFLMFRDPSKFDDTVTRESNVRLFLPQSRTRTRKRRFERPTYKDEAHGGTRNESMYWRTESYFDGIVW